MRCANERFLALERHDIGQSVFGKHAQKPNCEECVCKVVELGCRFAKLRDDLYPLRSRNGSRKDFAGSRIRMIDGLNPGWVFPSLGSVLGKFGA